MEKLKKNSQGATLNEGDPFTKFLHNEERRQRERVREKK